MDEEALLKQFAAQFAHGPDDADDTDAAAAAQGADSTANQVADDADQSPATFDTQQFDFRSPHGRHRSRPVLGTGDGGRGKRRRRGRTAHRAQRNDGLLSLARSAQGESVDCAASAGTGRSYGLDHRHIRGVGHHANQLRHLDARGQTIRSGRGFVSSGAECLPAFAGAHRP